MAVRWVALAILVYFCVWINAEEDKTVFLGDGHNLTHHHNHHHHHHAIPTNTSSPEFKKIAAETYRKVLPCLTSSWMLQGKNIDFKFPDDAEAHYEELKNKTACYRAQPVHEYAGYSGPWIENIFISKFIDRPLYTFRGLIPLYIQWIDNQILRGRYFDYIYAELGVLLRPDVIYIAISQGDVGLGKIGVRYPNILALAAGGFGHVPIPLVKGYLSPIPQPDKFRTDIGFYGKTVFKSIIVFLLLE